MRSLLLERAPAAGEPGQRGGGCRERTRRLPQWNSLGVRQPARGGAVVCGPTHVGRSDAAALAALPTGAGLACGAAIPRVARRDVRAARGIAVHIR